MARIPENLCLMLTLIVLARFSQMSHPAEMPVDRLAPPRGGSGGKPPTRLEQDYLHDAIVSVLKDAGDPGLTPGEIRRRVVSRGLYRQLDGTELSLQQVYARLSNYQHLFEFDRSVRPMVIRLASHGGAR